MAANQNQNQNLFGNANQEVNLYAQDGQVKKVTLGSKGELSFEDTQWLNQHGGAMPLNQVPVEERAFIRQTPESVAARRQSPLNNQGGGQGISGQGQGGQGGGMQQQTPSQQGGQGISGQGQGQGQGGGAANFAHANSTITLYAQDGQTKQATLGDKGELLFDDVQWLNQHGGAMPLDQVPQQDKAFIRQNPATVAARRQNFQGGANANATNVPGQ